MHEGSIERVGCAAEATGRWHNKAEGTAQHSQSAGFRTKMGTDGRHGGGNLERGYAWRHHQRMHNLSAGKRWVCENEQGKVGHEVKRRPVVKVEVEGPTRFLTVGGGSL